MGSQTHRQSTPQRPSLATSRTTEAVLERYREKQADIRPVIYVRPLGVIGGVKMHLVRNECNDQVYRVAGPRTFSPGSNVFVGSNAGHPGEVIISEPPAGRGGASLVTAQIETRTVPNLGVPAVTKTYLGITKSGTTLYAALWRDGSWSEAVTNTTYAPAGYSGASLLSTSPRVVAWRDGSRNVVVWNLATNTLVQVAGVEDLGTANPGTGYGGRYYWLETDTVAGDYVQWIRSCNAAGGDVTTHSPVSPTPVDTGSAFIATNFPHWYVSGGAVGARSLLDDSGPYGYLEIEGTTQAVEVIDAAYIALPPGGDYFGFNHEGIPAQSGGTIYAYEDGVNEIFIGRVAPGSVDDKILDESLLIDADHDGLVGAVMSTVNRNEFVSLFGDETYVRFTAATDAAVFTAIEQDPDSADYPDVFLPLD